MPYAKTCPRRQKRDLREQMRSMGLGDRDIAAGFARRYSQRPRAARREAYGWRAGHGRVPGPGRVRPAVTLRHRKDGYHDAQPRADHRPHTRGPVRPG
jgi:hypothetical protein